MYIYRMVFLLKNILTLNFAFQLYYHHHVVAIKPITILSSITETLESVKKSNNSGEKDNETILAINKLLEEEKNKDKISKHLYMHVKGKVTDSKFNLLYKVSFCNS